jgi:hypothetical protein
MANSKTSELKKKFVTGATPTETDYQDLINLADVGRKAVGVPDGEGDPKPGDGLDYDSKDGKLSVKRKEISGLTVSDKGLGVKPGVGVQLGDNTVKLAIKAESALTTDGGALHIKTGDGVTELGGNLTIDVNNSQGLSMHNGTLQVNFEPKTVKADNGVLTVKYDEDYFTVDSELGLRLLPKWFEKLETEFCGAVKKAVSGTSCGSKQNSNTDSSTLEQKIADALQRAYAAGQRDGFTKPPELANIIRDGLRYLEQEASDTEISQLHIDEDHPAKAERKLLVAHQLWSRWLRTAESETRDGCITITYPSEGDIPLRTGMPGAYRIDVANDDIIKAEAGPDRATLRPVAIGRTAVTPRREITVLGRRVEVREAAVTVEVKHPEYSISDCHVQGNGYYLQELEATGALGPATYKLPRGAAEPKSGLTQAWVRFCRRRPDRRESYIPDVEVLSAVIGGVPYKKSRIRFSIPGAPGGTYEVGAKDWSDREGNPAIYVTVTVRYERIENRVLPGSITLRLDGALWPIKFE